MSLTILFFISTARNKTYYKSSIKSKNRNNRGHAKFILNTIITCLELSGQKFVCMCFALNISWGIVSCLGAMT